MVSKLHNDIRIYISWHQIDRQVIKSTLWCQSRLWRQNYAMKSEITSWNQKYIMMSKVSHDVKITPWHQKVHHDVKEYVMTSKVLHDVRYYAMTSKVYRCQLVCHDVMSGFHHITFCNNRPTFNTIMVWYRAAEQTNTHRHQHYNNLALWY